MILFKVFLKGAMILLISQLLLNQMLYVEAGLYGFGDEHKNDEKDNSLEKPLDDEEHTKLAVELTELDHESAQRKPIKFSSVLAAIKHQDEADGEASVTADLEVEGEHVFPERREKGSALGMMRVRHNQAGPNSQTQQGRIPPRTTIHTIKPSNKNGNNANKNPTAAALRHPHLDVLMNSKVLHAHYWTKEIKDGLEAAGQAVIDLPGQIKDASDTIVSSLKLSSKGRLTAMVSEVDEDIAFVRREFNGFSLTWSEIMEKSLSYIGLTDLNNLKHLDKDELDFRRDALITAAFAYEFMSLFITWRENLMVGHQAYKSYLEQVILDQEKEKFSVNEEYIYQLEVIHNYFLLSSWMELEAISTETKMKLDYLMKEVDMKPKNYESEYFRSIIVLQELYEPTSEEFKAEKKQVVDALSDTGVISNEQFEDIDEYLANYKNDLVENPNDHTNIEWSCPEELSQFMGQIEPELRYNRLIYEKSFLKELKIAKKKALMELYESN